VTRPTGASGTPELLRLTEVYRRTLRGYRTERVSCRTETVSNRDGVLCRVPPMMASGQRTESRGARRFACSTEPRTDIARGMRSAARDRPQGGLRREHRSRLGRCVADHERIPQSVGGVCSRPQASTAVGWGGVWPTAGEHRGRLGRCVADHERAPQSVGEVCGRPQASTADEESRGERLHASAGPSRPAAPTLTTRTRPR
jgi:hypothetical protein